MVDLVTGIMSEGVHFSNIYMKIHLFFHRIFLVRLATFPEKEIQSPGMRRIRAKLRIRIYGTKHHQTFLMSKGVSILLQNSQL